MNGNPTILRVTLDIPVRELTDDEKSRAGYDPTWDFEDMSEFDGVAPTELADIVTNLFSEDAVQEAFAGSGLFLLFDTDPKVVSAEWLP